MRRKLLVGRFSRYRPLHKDRTLIELILSCNHMTSHENYLPVEAVEQLHGSDVADPVLVGDVSRCVAGLLVTQECWLLTL